jgi:hypothetical protein
MTYKWDAEEARKYANKTAAAVCEDIYSDRDAVSGDEILDCTPVRQINLLIIREIYERWQEEMLRLKSPYFDFQEPEVQAALDEFMNILSQYISVKRKEFEVILSNAVEDTLQLSLNPSGFFEKYLRNLPNFRLTSEWLIENRKYILQNRFVLDELAQKLATSQTLYANEAILWANEVLKQKGSENATETIEKLNEIFPISEGLKIKNEIFVPKIGEKKEATRSFFDKVADDYTEPIAAVSPRSSVFEPTPEKVQETVLPEIVVPNIQQNIRLNKQHEKVVATTLNDKNLATGGVNDYHRLSRVESMRSAISINQRYLFINNLFGGNVEAFSHAIDEIDALKSFADARELILKKYVPRYLWDVTSAEAEEFFDILKRRFN